MTFKTVMVVLSNSGENCMENFFFVEFCEENRKKKTAQGQIPGSSQQRKVTFFNPSKLFRLLSAFENTQKKKKNQEKKQKKQEAWEI